MKPDRRKAIRESNYALPSNGEKAMFDFYALYALWWAHGSGREEYGYMSSDSKDMLRRRHIDKAFEACAFQLAEAMCSAMSDAIYEEAEDACDKCLIPAYVFAKWLRHSAPKEMADLYLKHLRKSEEEFEHPPRGKFWQIVGFDGAKKLFEAPFWEEHADQFGGPKWATITEATRALFDAFKHDKPAKDVAVYIDRIYDLRHNSDSIGAKLGPLKVSTKALDIRAGLKSPAEFLPYVSDDVANMIRASDITNEWAISPWKIARRQSRIVEVAGEFHAR